MPGSHVASPSSIKHALPLATLPIPLSQCFGLYSAAALWDPRSAHRNTRLRANHSTQQLNGDRALCTKLEGALPNPRSCASGVLVAFGTAVRAWLRTGCWGPRS